MRRKTLIKDLFACAALVCMGFAAVYFYASGTSPIRPDTYQWDSALFQVVGKLWADGLTPYVDIFDHKGPLLFFIQRIAYTFPNPRIALYIIESLSAGITLVLGYACMRLAWKPLWAFAGTAVMALFWLPLMEYGNLCETYCLPFLMLSLYGQLRYLLYERKTHPCLWALAYGLCFGANLMIRPNNGILIAVITLVITLDLMSKRQWKNILCNALTLIAGVLVAVIPFVAYFWLKDAMREFVYASWTYNLEYAGSLEFRLVLQDLKGVLYYITPSVLCIGLGFISLWQKRWRMAAVLTLSAVATLLITVSGVGYAHYFMLHVPLVALAFAFVPGLHRGWWKPVLIAACAGFALLTCRASLPYAVEQRLTPYTAEEAAQEAAYDELVQTLQNEIPAQDRDRVAVSGLWVTDAELFLKTDLHPVGRYCFLLEWHSRADNAIKFRYLRSLERGEAKWLICRKEETGEDVLAAIDRLFTLQSVHEHDGYQYFVYRFKEA